VPPSFADARAAWEGTFPERPGTPIRVEAAAGDGRLVSVQVVGPWTRPNRIQDFPLTTSQKMTTLLFLLVFLAVVVGAAALARRHLHQGRADRRGALRLAYAIVAFQLVSFALMANHVAAFEEWTLVAEALGRAFLQGALVWLLYVALEPYVRRHWPERIISWNRLLAGRFRDPLVGRDLLLGGVIGVVIELAAFTRLLVPEWLGLPPAPPYPAHVTPTLLGGPQLAGAVVSSIGDAVLSSMLVLGLFLVLRMVLRRQWIAGTAFMAIFALSYLGGPHPVPVLEGVFGAALGLVLLLTLIRYGLVATIASQILGQLLETFPMTLDSSVWYAKISLFNFAIAAMLFGYAFYISRAGGSLLGRRILAD
jgi:serine/threonine-protein kinase